MPGCAQRMRQKGQKKTLSQQKKQGGETLSQKQKRLQAQKKIASDGDAMFDLCTKCSEECKADPTNLSIGPSKALEGSEFCEKHAPVPVFKVPDVPPQRVYYYWEDDRRLHTDGTPVCFFEGGEVMKCSDVRCRCH